MEKMKNIKYMKILNILMNMNIGMQENYKQFYNMHNGRNF